MPTFENSPRIIKGALVGINPIIPIPNLILFQYNPDSLTRRLEARSTGGGEGSDRAEAFRLTGPPKETITLSVEMDAADQLERVDPLAVISGLAPALAALELMLYPKSDHHRQCDSRASRHFGDYSAGSAVDRFRLGPAARRAGAPHRVQHYGRSLRYAAKSHSRQSGIEPASFEHRRFALAASGLQFISGASNRQRGFGHGELNQQRRHPRRFTQALLR